MTVAVKAVCLLILMKLSIVANLVLIDFLVEVARTGSLIYREERGLVVIDVVDSENDVMVAMLMVLILIAVM